MATGFIADQSPDADQAQFDPEEMLAIEISPRRLLRPAIPDRLTGDGYRHPSFGNERGRQDFFKSSIMIYTGIDIGKDKHCIAAISETAEVLLKPAFVEQSHESFKRIDEGLRQIGDPSQLKIGMEDSGHYWTHFFHFLSEAGWTVEPFNPVLSNSQGRSHLRGRFSQFPLDFV